MWWGVWVAVRRATPARRSSEETEKDVLNRCSRHERRDTAVVSTCRRAHQPPPPPATRALSLSRSKVCDADCREDSDTVSYVDGELVVYSSATGKGEGKTTAPLPSPCRPLKGKKS